MKRGGEIKEEIDKIAAKSKSSEHYTVRQMRWTRGVCCPKCQRLEVIKRGKDETQPACQRYHCKTCNTNFDDLTNTIFEGHHQPLRMWILCLYLMGLNLSNRQIAQELDLDKDLTFHVISETLSRQEF